MSVVYEKGLGVEKDAARSKQWCARMRENDREGKLPDMYCGKD